MVNYSGQCNKVFKKRHEQKPEKAKFDEKAEFMFVYK